MEKQVHSLHEFVDVAERASKVLYLCRKVLDVFGFDEVLRFTILLPAESNQRNLELYLQAPNLMPGVDWYESDGMTIFKTNTGEKVVYLITT